MSDFKPGDRVRAERSGIDGQNQRGEWIEGVVTEPYGPENPNELSVRRDDNGHHVFVYADTAVLLDEKPKVGDRVRVIHEGTVVAVNGLGFHFRTDDDRSVYAGKAKHEVEVLERKPEPAKAKTDYAVGTRLVVTGDTAHWNHQFDKGTVVTVKKTGRGKANGGYPEGTFGYYLEGGGRGWDVSEADLELAPEPEPFKPGTLVKGNAFAWIVTDKGSVTLDPKTFRVLVAESSVTGARLAKEHALGHFTVVHEPASS